MTLIKQCTHDGVDIQIHGIIKTQLEVGGTGHVKELKVYIDGSDLTSEFLRVGSTAESLEQAAKDRIDAVHAERLHPK